MVPQTQILCSCLAIWHPFGACASLYEMVQALQQVVSPPPVLIPAKAFSTPSLLSVFTCAARIAPFLSVAACSVNAVRRNVFADSASAAFHNFCAGTLTFPSLSSLFSFAAAGNGCTASPTRQRTQHATGSMMASVSALLNGYFPFTASAWRHGARATPIRLVASSVKRRIVSLMAGFEKRPMTVLIHSFLFKPLTSLHVLAAAAIYCSKNFATPH